MAELICTTCKKKIANERGIARFPCPKCAKQEIVRCRHCREIVAQYKCQNCDFIGPN